jgi:hypothetical protein
VLADGFILFNVQIIKRSMRIYKISRTNGFNHTTNEYLLDTQIISAILVNDDKKYKCKLIEKCKFEFEYRNDIRGKYFERMSAI